MISGKFRRLTIGIAVLSITLCMAMLAACSSPTNNNSNESGSSPDPAQNTQNTQPTDNAFLPPDLDRPHVDGSLMVKLVDGISEEDADAELAKIEGYGHLEFDHATFFASWIALKCEPDTDLTALIEELSHHSDVFADAQLDYMHSLESRSGDV